MNKLIIINDDGSVSVVLIADSEVDIETEAKKIGAVVYDGDIPDSDFLKWENEKVVIDLDKEKLEKATTIKMNLMTLCDTKQDEAEKLILGYKATPKQLQRYQDKYIRSKAGEFDTATNEVIIKNHETYLTALRNLVDLIELFRSNVDDLIIAGELDKASELIEIGKGFDSSTKLEDIQALFS